MGTKLGLVVVFSLTFLWAVLDLLVATSLLALEPGTSVLPWHNQWSVHQIQLQFSWITPENFDYRQTYVDLWILAVARSALTIGGVIGSVMSVQRQASRLLRRLKIGNKFMFCTCTLFMTYAPIKLLGYEEFNPGLNDVSFWANSAWNLIASIITVIMWYGVMSRAVKRYVAIMEEACMYDNSFDELNTASTSSLLDNEEVEPHETEVRVITSSAKKDKNKKKGKSSGKKKKSDDASSSSSSDGSSSEDEEHDNDDELFDGPDTTSSFVLLFKLLGYCKKEWPWYVLGFGAILAYSASNIMIPYYTGQTISSIVISHSYVELRNSVLMVFLLSFSSAFFGGLRGGSFSLVIAKIARKVRYDLFSSVMRQEIGFFDRVKSGNINSRITADCETMSNTIGLNINIFTRNFVMLIGSLIIMFRLSWQLTIVTVVITPVVTIISQVYGEWFDKLSKRLQDTLAKSNEVADEVISSMRTVRSFANEKHEIKRYESQLDKLLRVYLLEAVAYVGYIWSNEFFYLLTLIGTLWYGGHLVISGRMLGSDLVSFLLYQLQLGENLENIGSVWTGMMQSVGASRKVFRLINRQPAFDIHEGKYFANTVQGKIEFRDVCFAYPTREDVQVLNNLSFVVAPGEMVALVGPSGGGKSSCISLIQHFYRPTSGQVLLDGRPVQQYEHQHLHRIVSLVSQEPVLYARSVADNIAYGLDDDRPSREEIELTAKQANAHVFISEQPEGYETEVGEKGQQLSGGQKQRVAIARSLIRRPKILLLDEATSALDSESEHLVQEAIYRNVEGHTVLLIAHRLSTVEKADRIVVIDKGRVVQQGKHAELLTQDGLYRNLVSRQLLGGVLPSSPRTPSDVFVSPTHSSTDRSSRASQLSRQSSIGSPSKRVSIRRTTETEMHGHPHASIDGLPGTRLLSKSP